MRGRTPLAGLWCIICMALACEEAEIGPLIEVVDSAGIRVYEVDLDRAPASMRLDSSPVWTFGGLESPGTHEPFYLVVDAHLGSDSMLYVAEWSTQSIIAVDPRVGKAVRFGKSGDGPGEFRALSSVHPPGAETGRITGFDRRNFRLTTFDSSGHVVSIVPVPRPTALGGIQELHLSGDKTTFLLEISSLPAPGQSIGEYRPVTPVLMIKERMDTITWVLGQAVYNYREGVGALVYGAEPVAAAGVDGLWLGDSGEPVLWHWASATATVDRIVRWTMRGRAITAAGREALGSALLDELGVEELAARRRVLAVLQWADQLPAFGAVLESSCGRYVWIGSRFAPRQGIKAVTPRGWLVVDLEQPGAARLEVPEGFRILQVVDGLVVGLHVDSLGVETLRAYRVEAMHDPSRGRG